MDPAAVIAPPPRRCSFLSTPAAPLAISDDNGGVSAPPTNQASHKLRVAAVVALLAQGGTRSDVIDLAATEWGISSRSVDRLMRLAREEIKAAWSEVERADLLAQLLTSLSELQQHARKTGQLGIALGCINATAKLAGLHEPHQPLRLRRAI